MRLPESATELSKTFHEKNNSVALFRLSVLGPLISRDKLEQGEKQRIICELAQGEYTIPGSIRRHIGSRTIENWYYKWQRAGIDGLTPKIRLDNGTSKLPTEIQELIRWKFTILFCIHSGRFSDMNLPTKGMKEKK